MTSGKYTVTAGLAGILTAGLLVATLSAQQADEPAMFPVLKEGKWGYIDATGRLAIATKFAWGGEFSGGLAPVRILGPGGKPLKKLGYGYVNSTGAAAFEVRFDLARKFSEGLAAVRVDKKWGYVNKRGKLEIPPEYDWAEHFSESFAVVRKGRLYWYINHKFPYRGAV